MPEVFKRASCRTVDGEKPIADALPVWRELLRKRGASSISSQLSDYAGYRRLIQQGGKNTFFQAAPDAAELATLRKDSPEQFALVMRWLANCVGLADPVLIWTLRNNSGRELRLTEVEYNVLDVGQVKGGGPGAVEIIDVQPHDLIHEKGVHTETLMPPVDLPPNSHATVRIRYRLDSKDWGLTWLVRAVFRASDGTQAASDDFMFFGAKNSPS
jgi:hypothetical protein